MGGRLTQRQYTQQTLKGGRLIQRQYTQQTLKDIVMYDECGTYFTLQKMIKVVKLVSKIA